MAVYYDKRKRNYVARKFQQGVNTFIGCYATEQDAREAVVHYEMTGEKLEREGRIIDYYHSQGLKPTYPSYEELRQRHKNQAAVLTSNYK